MPPAARPVGHARTGPAQNAGAAHLTADQAQQLRPWLDKAGRRRGRTPQRRTLALEQAIYFLARDG